MRLSYRFDVTVLLLILNFLVASINCSTEQSYRKKSTRFKHENFLKSLSEQNEFDQVNCGETNLRPEKGNFVCKKPKSSWSPSSFNHHHYYQEKQVTGNKRKKRQALPKINELRKGNVPAHTLIECGTLDKKYKINCNGILIGKEFVLTAASCLLADKIEYCKLTFGYVDGRTDLKEIQINYSIYHCELEKFKLDDKDGHQNDVAIIQLYKPVKFNDFVQPACIETSRKQEIGYCASVGNELNEGGDRNKLVKLDMFPTCLNYDGNHDTDHRTCYTAPNSANLCKDNIGTGLYCLDTCNNRIKHYAMGLMSFRNNLEACNATSSNWVFFSDFRKLAPLLEPKLANCRIPKRSHVKIYDD